MESLPLDVIHQAWTPFLGIFWLKPDLIEEIT